MASAKEDSDEGYILDIDRVDKQATDLRTAPDGHTLLIPQPSDDENDPLNWSNARKNSVLFLISVIAFLPDFGSSTGIVALLPQAVEWNRPQDTIQHNLVGNLFCLGAGGLFVVMFSDYFGRLPILFWFQLMSLGTGIWCAVAQSFESYLAARIVSGLFATAAQAGGLMWIKDMYFFHERPRKINLWSGGVIISPYLGPFCAAFIISRTTWRWGFFVYSVLNLIGLILILILGEETYFDRRLRPDQQPPWRSRFLRMIGIEKHPRRTVKQAATRPAVAISKVVVFATTVYYFLNFAWIIGVNATISVWLTSYYHFKAKSLGFFYFAPMIGSVLGELAGHWMHDMIGRIYAKRHGGRINPEARLIICYPASAFMAVGILVLGFALQNRWHYMVVAVFAALQVSGILIATTAVNAYLLDSYPEGSGEVGAWINVGRSFGGFMATYIEIPWVGRSGTATVFGIQAGITVAAALIPLLLQVFGQRLRHLQGPMRFLDEKERNERI